MLDVTEELYHKVRIYALRFTNDVDDAEDLTQEVFTRVVRLDVDATHGQGIALLQKITRNVWYDKFREYQNFKKHATIYGLNSIVNSVSAQDAIEARIDLQYILKAIENRSTANFTTLADCITGVEVASHKTNPEHYGRDKARVSRTRAWARRHYPEYAYAKTA